MRDVGAPTNNRQKFASFLRKLKKNYVAGMAETVDYMLAANLAYFCRYSVE